MNINTEKEEKWFEKAPKKIIRIGFPRPLQFSIIWVIFFTIIGIVLQALNDKKFILAEAIQKFFITNYIGWFNSLGNFTSSTTYPSYEAMFQLILSNWYYFFLTGGVVALIWGIISWIIHWEIIIIKPSENKEDLDEHLTKINQLLAEGMKYLFENNIVRAEAIYITLKGLYDSSRDPGQVYYNKILDFYRDLIRYKK